MSFNLDDLLELFTTNDARRPQEVVEILFDVRTCKATERTIAVDGGALFKSEWTGENRRERKRHRCIIREHNRVRHRDRNQFGGRHRLLSEPTKSPDGCRRERPRDALTHGVI